MSNKNKKIVSIIGIIVGIAIVIIGFSIMSADYAYVSYSTASFNEITNSTKTGSIGESIRFGADFYTEMYSVTQDVGYAVNNNTAAVKINTDAVNNSGKAVTQAINNSSDALTQALNNTNSLLANICRVISWLIVSLGAIDICFFSYKLIKTSEAIENTPSPKFESSHTNTSENTNSERINKLKTLLSKGLITEEEYQQAISRDQQER